MNATKIMHSLPRLHRWLAQLDCLSALIDLVGSRYKGLVYQDSRKEPFLAVVPGSYVNLFSIMLIASYIYSSMALSQLGEYVDPRSFLCCPYPQNSTLVHTLL